MPRTPVLRWFGAVTLACGVLSRRTVYAAIGDCGQPTAAGPVAVDALEVLRTAIGTSDCGGHDTCICDVNSSGSVTASDALSVLRKAVGQNVTLTCPCAATTTTSTGATTTTTGATTTTTFLTALPTKELHLLQRISGAYAASDLPGNWEVNFIAVGPGGPYWARGEIPVDSGGSFSATLTGPGNQTADIAGTLHIANDGKVTCTNGCDADFEGALDSGKTVFVSTSVNNHGSGLLFVTTRKGNGYAKADLAGVWRLESLVSGVNEGRWSTGTITIDANGAVSIDSVDSDGTVHTVNENYSIDAGGVITCSNGCRPDFRGVMDSGKTVIVTTATNPDSTAKLNVLTRQADSHALSDLPGNWASTTLSAGPDLPLWFRGRLAIAANGAISGTLTDDTGAQLQVSDTLAITQDGLITSSGDPHLRCSLDSEKSVIACVDSR